MSQREFAQQARKAVTRLLPITLFMSLALMVLFAALAQAQNDSATAAVSAAASSPLSEPPQSGSLALFTGFQQGVRTEQGQTAGAADWLLGASPGLPLSRAWELSPELTLWHLTARDVRVALAPFPPTGGKAIGEKWKWYMKLGLPIRWFPFTSGRFSAYALGGPACLLSGGTVVTLDVGGGVRWELSRMLSLTGEMRTYLYYHSSESIVLTSPLSILCGVRLKQVK